MVALVTRGSDDMPLAILAEWSRAEMPVPANDAGKAAASENEEAR